MDIANFLQPLNNIVDSFQNIFTIFSKYFNPTSMWDKNCVYGRVIYMLVMKYYCLQ